jgi:hypothetical protein
MARKAVSGSLATASRSASVRCAVSSVISRSESGRTPPSSSSASATGSAARDADPSIARAMPAPYAAALSAWRRHIVHTRRQATAWRFAAVASMALCVGLGGVLSASLVRPAVAFHYSASGN